MDNSFPAKSIDVAPIIGAALAGMANPVSGPLGEASQLVNNTGTTASQSTMLSNLPEENNQNKMPQPQSGINFVLYNSSFDVVDENTGYLPVDEHINAIQILATDELIMAEAGFLEIFVNNEAQTPVYYDNLMVVMRGGNAQEVNAYYPGGLIITDLSTANATTGAFNAYKYNTKELQTDLSLNWLDYGARMMDPVVNRWWTPDPLAEKHYNISPYAYCGNQPINRIDPNGMDWYEEDDIYKFDPEVSNENQAKKLREGQKYLGPTHQVRDKDGKVTENYRKDGSIMYANEASAYNRMVKNSKKTGKEEMGVITNDGVLVVPSYKNSNGGVNLSDYNYRVEDGNVIDANGTVYNTIATAHTHPKGGPPTMWDIEGGGDLVFAGLSTPDKPVYVFRMTKEDINPISFIISGENLTRKYSDFNNFGIYDIPKTLLNVQSLLKDSTSLRNFTIENKIGNLRKGR